MAPPMPLARVGIIACGGGTDEKCDPCTPRAWLGGRCPGELATVIGPRT